eukprot:1155646-Pelagomonas_calceolata.AAC.4
MPAPSPVSPARSQQRAAMINSRCQFCSPCFSLLVEWKASMNWWGIMSPCKLDRTVPGKHTVQDGGFRLNAVNTARPSLKPVIKILRVPQTAQGLHKGVAAAEGFHNTYEIDLGVPINHVICPFVILRKTIEMPSQCPRANQNSFRRRAL